MEKNVYLYVNTSNYNKVEVFLIRSNEQKMGSIGFFCEYQFKIKDNLLKTVDKILIQNNIAKKNLNGIIAINKSKEMASLRIGVSSANALAYSLNIPIVGIEEEGELSLAVKDIQKTKIFRPIKPKYEINPMLKNKKIQQLLI